MAEVARSLPTMTYTGANSVSAGNIETQLDALNPPAGCVENLKLHLSISFKPWWVYRIYQQTNRSISKSEDKEF